MDDLISRQAALDALGEEPLVWHEGEDEIAERNQWRRDVNAIKAVPSVQPDIIMCKDCKRHNIGIGDFREDGNTRHWLWKDEACPLVQYRGKAQGHEFDYQFCAYAERRPDK